MLTCGASKTRKVRVALGTAGDATLGSPGLILPTLPVAMRGAGLPPPGKDGKRHLKVPIDGLWRLETGEFRASLLGRLHSARFRRPRA